MRGYHVLSTQMGLR